jgi:hypothetical protein
MGNLPSDRFLKVSCWFLQGSSPSDFSRSGIGKVERNQFNKYWLILSVFFNLHPMGLWDLQKQLPGYW